MHYLFKRRCTRLEVCYSCVCISYRVERISLQMDNRRIWFLSSRPVPYTPVDARGDHSGLLEREGRMRLIEMGRINRLLGIKGISESVGGVPRYRAEDDALDSANEREYAYLCPIARKGREKTRQLEECITSSTVNNPNTLNRTRTRQMTRHSPRIQ